MAILHHEVTLFAWISTGKRNRRTS